MHVTTMYLVQYISKMHAKTLRVHKGIDDVLFHVRISIMPACTYTQKVYLLLCASLYTQQMHCG